MVKRKVLNWPIRDRILKPNRVEPDVLYHGTSSRNLSSIKRHGLLPAGRPGIGATGSKSWTISGGSRSDMLGLVGVTDKTRSAAFYASVTTPPRSKNQRPIILVIDRKKLDKRKMSYRRGSHIRGGKEWDYPDRIPASAIKGYWVLIKSRDGRKRWIYRERP